MKRIISIIVLLIATVYSGASQNLIQSDDGYLIGIGMTKDHKSILVDIFFSYGYVSSSESEIQAREHLLLIAREFLSIEIRNYLFEDFFPGKNFQEIEDIISDDTCTVLYDNFLEYISKKELYKDIQILNLKMKKQEN
jgi:hypothetical protein